MSEHVCFRGSELGEYLSCEFISGELRRPIPRLAWEKNDRPVRKSPGSLGTRAYVLLTKYSRAANRYHACIRHALHPLGPSLTGELHDVQYFLLVGCRQSVPRESAKPSTYMRTSNSPRDKRQRGRKTDRGGGQIPCKHVLPPPSRYKPVEDDDLQKR